MWAAGCVPANEARPTRFATEVYSESMMTRSARSAICSNTASCAWRRPSQTRTMGTALEQRVRLGTNKAGKWLERTLRRPSVDPALLEAIAFAEAIADEHVGARTSTLDVTAT